MILQHVVFPALSFCKPVTEEMLNVADPAYLLFLPSSHPPVSTRLKQCQALAQKKTFCLTKGFEKKGDKLKVVEAKDFSSFHSGLGTAERRFIDIFVYGGMRRLVELCGWLIS
jgi:hypothetical protein